MTGTSSPLPEHAKQGEGSRAFPSLQRLIDASINGDDPSKNSQVLATESEARIYASRQTDLAEEAALELRHAKARELRERHDKAAAKLSAEMGEKTKKGREGVAARLKV